MADQDIHDPKPEQAQSSIQAQIDNVQGFRMWCGYNHSIHHFIVISIYRDDGFQGKPPI